MSNGSQFEIDFEFFSDSQIHHYDDLIDLVLIILIAIYAFFGWLIVCELSQRLNVEYEECSSMASEFDWYRFPIEIQRIYPTILAFIQQPMEMRCVGGTPSDRKSFKYVSVYITSTTQIIHSFRAWY